MMHILVVAAAIVFYCPLTSPLQFMPQVRLNRKNFLGTITSTTTGIILPTIIASPPASLAGDVTPYSLLHSSGGADWSSFLLDRSKSVGKGPGGIWNYEISIGGVGKTRLGDYFDENELPRPAALIFANMKQDDPVSRLQLPQLLTLTKQFPSLCLILIPTDQGYFEADTSELIRMKLRKEYGFSLEKSQSPHEIIAGKQPWLGESAKGEITGYLSSVLPAPVDEKIGVRGNYEKFLVDGKTGIPMRRYSKGYEPRNMARDIGAVIDGGNENSEAGVIVEVPPARNGFLESWREEIESFRTDTYRFQKGLNYFDS